MKRILIALLLLLCVSAKPDTVWISWNQSPPEFAVTNYIVIVATNKLTNGMSLTNELTNIWFASFQTLSADTNFVVYTRATGKSTNAPAEWASGELPWDYLPPFTYYGAMAENEVGISVIGVRELPLERVPDEPEGIKIREVKPQETVEVGFTNLPTHFRIDHAYVLDRQTNWQGYFTMQLHDPYAWPGWLSWTIPLTNINTPKRQFWRIEPIQ